MKTNTSFCPDPLWNINVTWNTDNPNLTQCAQLTVLPSVSAIWLVLSLPFWIASLCNRSPPHTLNTFQRVRFCAKLLLCVLIFVGIGINFSLATDNLTNVYSGHIFYLSCMVISVTYAAIIVITDKGQGSITNSCLLTVFWALLTFCSLATFKINIEYLISEHDYIPRIFAVILTTPTYLLQLILHCFSDVPDSSHLAPEDRSSFGSLLIFGWLSPIIKNGFKRTLIHEDLPNNPKTLNTGVNVKSFLNEWQKGEKGQVNIWKVICKVYGPRFAFSIVLSIIYVFLTYVSPQLLHVIIVYVQTDDQPKWRGIFYTFLLFFNYLGGSLLFNHFSQILTVLASQMRGALVTAIYRKSLKLSNDAKQIYTTGDITNYVNVDSQLILDCLPWSNHLISDPILIFMGIGFIYMEVGWIPTAAGVGFLVLLVPINTIGNKQIAKFDKQILEHKDTRMKFSNEALKGIQMLKMFAWEPAFMNRIHSTRDQEVKLLKKMATRYAFSLCNFSLSPFFMAIIVFSVYVALDPANNILTPEKIFVCVSLFSIMRLALELFPIVLFDNIRIAISINRIGKYLNAEEIDESIVSQRVETEDNAIEIRNAKMSWSKSESNSILSIDEVSIPTGSLTAIVGQVGSGKSSLLSSILGDMVLKNEGSIAVKGTVAYVPQQSWIQNATVKKNITFQSNMEHNNYRRIIKACALREDFQLLPHADETEIGENGVNLSGGQKQRVSLARAVYSDRDIYLLDDPLSAVDADVGEHIFREVISSEKGILKDKTRILVTHGIHFLEHADHIIVMDKGKVVEKGSFEQLIENGEAFAALIQEFSKKLGVTKVETRKRTISQQSNESGDETTPLLPNPVSNQLIQDEEVMEGKVRIGVYLDYFKTFGTKTIIFILVLFGISQALSAGATTWLAIWSDNNDDNKNATYYLTIYGVIGVIDAIITFGRQDLLFKCFALTSKRLHDTLLYHIFCSPMSFFDTTPTGRIANRLSSDIDTADMAIPQQISDFIGTIFNMTCTMIIISAVTPYFIPVVIVLAVMFSFLVRYYIGATRQIKRLESISKSPLLSHIDETLMGVNSIRSYQCQDNFIQTIEDRLYENIKCHYLGEVAGFWLRFRTDILGCIVVFSSTLMIVLMPKGSVSGGLAGLVISYALDVVLCMTWMVRMACSLETDSVCLERIIEYYKLPQEDEWNKLPKPSQWPVRGAIEFKNYSTRYRDGLDLSIRDVNLKINGGEKLGICGRTGAGKSSLSKALFRIIEPAGGQILIDDHDISLLGLHDLRSALTIIPQDPTLFTGSLRFNLDPTFLYSDSDIWQALELTHMKDHVSSHVEQLEMVVQERGENFSVGQRQLLCLARALLKRSRILVLDEATAAIDQETDAIVQATIRKEFKECTVLTIAHRLDTIKDYDRIVVLSQGRISQIGSPKEVFADRRNFDNEFED